MSDGWEIGTTCTGLRAYMTTGCHYLVISNITDSHSFWTLLIYTFNSVEQEYSVRFDKVEFLLLRVCALLLFRFIWYFYACFEKTACQFTTPLLMCPFLVVLCVFLLFCLFFFFIRSLSLFVSLSIYAYRSFHYTNVANAAALFDLIIRNYIMFTCNHSERPRIALYAAHVYESKRKPHLESER